MIEELEIKDLGVIAHASLALGPGFTAITGETGAGKTMVVTALGLLMGERSDAGTVRSGADRARVTGILHTTHPEVLRLTEDAGGEAPGGELILGRAVSAEGRSRAMVGGVAAPASLLAKLAPNLFAVHGQSDQIRLQSAGTQRDMLDRFGGETLLATRQQFSTVFTEHLRSAELLETLVSERRERVREAEQLRAELAEIAEVEPLDGEDEGLRTRIERLGNTEALRQAAEGAKQLLVAESDDPFNRDIVSLTAQAMRSLEGSGDAELDRVLDALASLQVQVTEAARDLGAFSHSLDEEGPEELARASDRLEQLTRLTRKYGADLAEVHTYAERAAVRLSELESDDAEIERLTIDTEALLRERDALGEQLSQLREHSASELAARVTRELQELALPDAALQVHVERAAPAVHGCDRIELRLRPHPGAPARPLGKGASGGELSRIMLALEVVVADTDPVATFVFDEVDAGIGGQAAIEIGRRLKKLARSSQVIVVTHLAQVAAFADRHLTVTKDRSGGFTESSCARVEGEARLSEVARLLSGMSGSQHALEHAAELIELGAS